MPKHMPLPPLLLILAVLLTPQPVLADGKVFVAREDWSQYAPVIQNEQRAVIAFGDGVEKMLIAINYNALPDDQGLWIFPVPGAPGEVRIDLTDQFPRFHGWDRRPVAEGIIHAGAAFMRASQLYPFVFDFAARGVKKAEEEGTEEAEVHAAVEKYGLRAEALTAPSVAALANHLKQAGLDVPTAELTAFEEYLTAEYVLVVVRIASRQELAETFGTEADRAGRESIWRRPCLFVEFPTEDGYYPMRPTATYGNVPIPVTLYVIGHVFADADTGTLQQVRTEYFRDSDPRTSLSPLFGIEAADPLDYTVVRMNAPAFRYTSDFTFYETYLWGFDLADALIWLAESHTMIIIAFGVFFLLSYVSAGLAGLLLRLRWRRTAWLGLLNILTIIAVAVGAHNSIERGTAPKFWLLFSVIFVALTLILQGLLVAALWWL